ncbi:MAG: ATP-dependent RNA helicase [Spirochaetaceae bacterium]|jgi:HrpA-like RNA helicase|nr:ATP-dependent RNA helicase [Spirochaetaceae bacterium]
MENNPTRIIAERLPVYEQKARILEAIQGRQVIIVQRPTGSGKTTQIPVILHEAGYSANGVIAVTQPRRIAALSVSAFIARQLGTSFPGLVGYKMRFEDKTDLSTRIKIMTDGILLQEMKLDPWLSRYTVVMVDEAHERSLNIDFVLGLLKRVLAGRRDFRVIVSSATMNAESFSAYFDNAPIVTIDTPVYPIAMVYDPVPEKAPPEMPDSAGGRQWAQRPKSTGEIAGELLNLKIAATIDRILDNKGKGAILCFLSGERAIKDCWKYLLEQPWAKDLWIVPLYGRLSKEEQERVFESAPRGKRKLVLSTNIAETSVTIPDVAAVIDSGMAKLNHYNPHTFTSSLVETEVSAASCDQRKGRAGRTGPGICYRLFSRSSFDTRPEFTTEEIFRTDLSEVLLRMSELNITDFETFDFISPPGKEGVLSARETLVMLKALNSDNTLSPTGELMARYPLLPRHSRIIVEAILRYPEVIQEVLIATAFLSAQSPYLLPAGEETEARSAHRAFREAFGDFASYLTLFRAFLASGNRERFCEKNYLDFRVMNEIVNIKEQLEQITGSIGIPIPQGDTQRINMDDYLCCIAAGMIQFVCVRVGRETYSSLTAEHIQIHPGSTLFRENPTYMVAGEVVRTSRTFAMSVSPLARSLLDRIDPGLEMRLKAVLIADGGRGAAEEAFAQKRRSRRLDTQGGREARRKSGPRGAERAKGRGKRRGV